MYNINRVGENVTSIEEYDVANINTTTYTVSGLTLVGTMYYSFDSNGKQFRKKYVPADGSEQKYVFEYQDEQNVAVQLPTGVVSHAKSDHLGRKVFDELQLGKGLMNRKFTYHEGVITDTHLDNDKQVSDPQTTLVKQIEFADGRTIQYEYDAEERITKVTDSVDGVYEYTYDELGQLLTEKVNGNTVNNMVYADSADPTKKYGNILEKNGVVYTYDTTWKDLLVKVGSQTITYDVNGNPTNYLGNTLEWEKGRQLKQYGANTYKYNNEGIRISKTVNGVEHKYILDGTNIVKETWGDNTLIPLYDLDGTVCGLKYNGIAYYFYKNLQGDVIAITNDAGQVIAKYSYDAWGKCTIVSDNSGVGIANINPFRYRSYYYDTETQLYYLQSRYYNPAVGRFINADVINQKILQADTKLNLFTYCDNNPINLTDHTGCISGTTLICFVAGIFVGFLIQLVVDAILFLFERYVCKNTAWRFKDQQNWEEYVASCLTWAVYFIIPFKKYKYLEKLSGLIIVVGKHIAKIFKNEFKASDFFVDLGLAVLAIVVSFAIDKKLAKKVKQIADIANPQDVARYLNDLMSVIVSVNSFGNTFTIAFNVSPAFIQKLVECIIGIL